MATIGYDDEALEAIARIARFIAQVDPAAAVSTVELIRDAMHIPETHPLIGRTTSLSLRELVISHGATGYVALYGYSPLADHVQIHGIRHQREAGFGDD